MGHKTSDDRFTISLNEPYIVIPDPSSTSASSATSIPDTQQKRLNGTVVIRLAKPTKVKSLSLVFSGMARTSFYFDSSSIPGAKPCLPCADKHSYSCTLTEHRQTFLSSNTKTPHVLSAGIHTFPFSIVISECLPAVISASAININYQVAASLQLMSLLPFASQHHVTKPVILLQRDELPSDDLFDTTVMRVKSKGSSRLSSHISIPCAVFPQAGVIPLILNLTLKGNATTLTKISIEMLESIFVRYPSEDSAQVTETLIDERLVTRQSCSIQDWPSSTPDEPVVILKRLMFKVPQLPLTTWSKSDEIHTPSCPRSSLDKGLCHASGTYAGANIRIAHSLHVVVLVKGLSSDARSTVEHDSGESETGIWIVGNQEYKDDEMNPPSYYRSFSTALVEGDKIYEMDQRALDALQSDMSSSAPPPGYEESLTMYSPRVSPIIRSWPDSNRTSMDQFSLIESLAESTPDPSDHDTYAHDLAAYTERYSYANHPVLAT